MASDSTFEGIAVYKQKATAVSLQKSGQSRTDSFSPTPSSDWGTTLTFSLTGLNGLLENMYMDVFLPEPRANAFRIRQNSHLGIMRNFRLRIDTTVIEEVAFWGAHTHHHLTETDPERIKRVFDYRNVTAFRDLEDLQLRIPLPFNFALFRKNFPFSSITGVLNVQVDVGLELDILYRTNGDTNITNNDPPQLTLIVESIDIEPNVETKLPLVDVRQPIFTTVTAALSSVIAGDNSATVLLTPNFQGMRFLAFAAVYTDKTVAVDIFEYDPISNIILAADNPSDTLGANVIEKDISPVYNTLTLTNAYATADFDTPITWNNFFGIRVTVDPSVPNNTGSCIIVITALVEKDFQYTGGQLNVLSAGSADQFTRIDLANQGTTPSPSAPSADSFENINVAGTATTNNLIVTGSLTAPAVSVSVPFLKAKGTSSADISGSDADITWAPPVIETSTIASAVSITEANINILIDGVYTFDVSLGCDANERTQLAIKTFIDSGTGYIEDLDEKIMSYVARNSNQNMGGIVLNTALSLVAGQRVKFVASAVASNSCTLSAPETRLLMSAIRLTPAPF